MYLCSHVPSTKYFAKKQSCSHVPSSKYAVQMHSCSPVPSSKYAAHMHSRVAYSAKYKVLISDAGSGSALLTSAV